MQLTKIFSKQQFDQALESWRWLDLGDREPMFASLFGDVFLHDGDGWWFLDTLEATLTREWDSKQDMMEHLNTDQGQDRYLMGALAMAAERNGLVLGDDDVYDFMPPPILGGSFAVENIFVHSFVVAVSISGQIHDQVRQLPPGTPITGFKFAE